jgi:hypothetical protein
MTRPRNLGYSPKQTLANHARKSNLSLTSKWRIRPVCGRVCSNGHTSATRRQRASRLVCRNVTANVFR